MTLRDFWEGEARLDRARRSPSEPDNAAARRPVIVQRQLAGPTTRSRAASAKLPIFVRSQHNGLFDVNKQMNCRLMTKASADKLRTTSPRPAFAVTASLTVMPRPAACRKSNL